MVKSKFEERWEFEIADDYRSVLKFSGSSKDSTISIEVSVPGSGHGMSETPGVAASARISCDDLHDLFDEIRKRAPDRRTIVPG